MMQSGSFGPAFRDGSFILLLPWPVYVLVRWYKPVPDSANGGTASLGQGGRSCKGNGNFIIFGSGLRMMRKFFR